MERRAGLQHRIHLRQALHERLDTRVGAVRGRVHVGEVEHGADPTEPPRDLDDVVGRAQLTHAPHHLDPERHRPVLPLEALPQLAELLHDGVDRLLAGAAEQKAGMEDDQLGARRLRDPCGVVEHADRHVQLLAALGMAHEAGDRSVHREDDVVFGRQRAEAGGEVVVHPEAACEVDLASGVAPLDEQPHGGLRALLRGHVGGPEMQASSHF